jgi:hypothetical protein
MSNINKLIEKVTSTNEELTNFLNGINNESITTDSILEKYNIEVETQEIDQCNKIIQSILKCLSSNNAKKVENSNKKETTEVTIKDEFLKNIKNNLKSIKLGYDIVMIMYIIAFFIGVLLIGSSLYFALSTEKEALLTDNGEPLLTDNEKKSLLLGGLGIADIIGTLIIRPPQDLQKSRGSLVLLSTVYHGYYNDMNNWNSYLQKYQDTITHENFKDVSSISIANLLNLTKQLENFFGNLKETKDKDDNEQNNK